MGFINQLKRYLNKEETSVLAEEQIDVSVILGFFAYIDLRARAIEPGDIQLPDEVWHVLNDIAERRNIDSYEQLYWELTQFMNTFMPQFGQASDKILIRAAHLVKLDPLVTKLAVQQAKNFLPIYDSSETLMYMEPEGHC